MQDGVQLVEDDQFNMDGTIQVAGTLAIAPEFQPLEPELLDVWKADATDLSYEERSSDVLLSDDWEWTEAKPLGSAVNDGIDAHIPASPSLTPDGLTMMFGRHADGFRWLVASRDSLDSEFEICHVLPDFPHGAAYGFSLGSFARQIVFESDGTALGNDYDRYDLFAYEMTELGEWRESETDRTGLGLAAR